MGKTKAKPKPPAKKTPAPKPAGVRAPEPPPAAGPVRQVAGGDTLDRIRPSPANPRKTFPAESIRELAASISAAGLQQPLVVRPVPPTADLVGGKWVGLDHYELVDGERRYRALRSLGWAGKVPVVVRWLSDAQALAAAVVANDQREDVRPSEQAAGYARLAEGRTAEDVAALVGKSAGFVRGLLRLARLPAWALAAVDAGTLPRATAEVVARVPGEESRRKAAACVLLNEDRPASLSADDLGELEAGRLPAGDDPILSYRETRRLVADSFQRELKNAPFSRKSLTLLPDAGSCDACPKRAGNDEEAKAEGVRADTCLDPDCYARKVKAHDALELAKGARLGALAAPEDFAWPMFSDAPPKGYCDLEAVAADTEIGPELAGHGDARKPLRDALQLHRHSPGNGPHWYVALDRGHKGRLVIRTAVARAELVRLGVLAKPERKPRERPPAPEPTGPERTSAVVVRCEKCKATFDAAGKSKCPSCSVAVPSPFAPSTLAKDRPLAEKVSDWDADEKAVEIAAGILGDFAEMNADDLLEIEKTAGEDRHCSALFEVLELVARFLVRDCCEFGAERKRFVEQALPAVTDGHFEPALKGLSNRRLAGLCVRLVAGVVLDGEAGAKSGFGHDLLEWAELDWPALQAQARRELAGGPSAGEHLDAPEAGEEPGEPAGLPPEVAAAEAKAIRKAGEKILAGKGKVKA